MTGVRTSTGPHILLTGVTGFVGQAVLERLLARPDMRVTALVRGRHGVCAQTRVEDLLAGAAFSGLRAGLGEAGLHRLWSRLRVLPGDLRDVPPLPADLDAVVHCASSVDFAPPIDDAFRANVGGAASLYAALEAAGGDPHVVHVSTAYVWADRVARAFEGPVEHDLDWRAELTRALSSRSRLEADGVAARDLNACLVDLGRAQARTHGWTDVYTLTKALGERVAEREWSGRGHRLTILRPTIIESALAHPFPGWIDGYKVADPLVVAYATGQLRGFPGRPDAVLDVVPVDVVVGVTLAALDEPARPGTPTYLQVGTGSRNPLTVDEFRALSMEYFERNPWTGPDGQPVRPRTWRFSPPGAFASRQRWRRRWLRLARLALARFPGQRAAALRRRTCLALRRLERLQHFADLYSPYTTSATTYDDSATRALTAAHARRRPAEAPCDVTGFSWRTYLQQGHLPSLGALMDQARGHRRRPARAHGRHRRAVGDRASA